MVCTSVQGQSTMRNELLKGIVRRIVRRAGVASTMEQTLRRLPGLQTGVTALVGGGVITARRGDVLLALGVGMAIVDVSATHQAGAANRAAAAARSVGMLAGVGWDLCDCAVADF
jgi:hypothetical protein